jgi:hypothetical protein
MPKFRKKPVVISAVQWTGVNVQEITEFLAGAELLPVRSALADVTLQKLAVFDYTATPPVLTIPTLEGDHRASVGDWIIRGVKGEFYPCKPDIFSATYDAVKDELDDGTGAIEFTVLKDPGELVDCVEAICTDAGPDTLVLMRDAIERIMVARSKSI